MNTLANFVHTKISDSCDNSKEGLSRLERAAWKDLQALFDRSPQGVAERLMARPSPAEWPTANYPFSSP